MNPPSFPKNPVLDLIPLLQDLSAETLRVKVATQHNTAASIAGGMMAAAGRPFSIEEAMSLTDSVHNAMFPNRGHGRYEAWAKEREDHMAKVWA